MHKIVENGLKNRDFLSGQYQILIPSCIFLDREVAFLEAIVEYLKEEYKLGYSQIADLLKRDQRNIRTTYLRTKDKRILRKTFVDESNIHIPLDVIANSKFTAFEAIVLHMRNSGASNKQLSVIFNRSAKTLSTIYTRAKKKSEADEKAN